MKAIKKICILMTVLTFSCSKYLDIVPDNVTTLDDIYSTRDQAVHALAKCYSYLPNPGGCWVSEFLLGDDIIGDLEDQGFNNVKRMQGMQSISSPLLGYWSGTGGASNLYQGIDVCNILIDNIDKAVDMSAADKADWKAQAMFLKAWYHFVLLQYYGPVVIMDKHMSADAEGNDLYPSRTKVNDCFDYIIKTIDAAIPNLKIQASGSDLGKIDQLVATAARAKVYLFRASPFYNDSKDIFGDFLDHDGQPFFTADDVNARKGKWKDALDAIEAAINLCEKNGKGLYSFTGVPYVYDRENVENNEQNMQTFYNLRMLIVDKWNKELVWGYSNVNQYGNYDLQEASNIALPDAYDGSLHNSNTSSWNWLAASYRMAERYYTINGLPLDDDATFNSLTKSQIVNYPGVDDPEYAPWRGIMQAGGECVRLYMNREMRFYANHTLSGGYLRAQKNLISTSVYAGGAAGYRSSAPRNYFVSGIGIKKFLHPMSESGEWQRTTRYPYPLIRMADLYLMKAEALNEYLDAPTSEVYDAVNIVRRRAGIPDVEVAWHNAAVVRPTSRDRHLTKEGMRDIIMRERCIELAYEGSRYWDMLRLKRAQQEFNSPIFGWAAKEATASSFFNLETKQERKFSVKDYLTPISVDELNSNANLIQNPGW